MKIRPSYVVLAVFIIATVIVIFVTGFLSGILRVVFGLPFLLFLSGFVLNVSLFPRKSTLGGIERLALGIALSVAVLALTTFLLNFTPWGIHLVSVAVTQAIFIAVIGGVAWYRQIKLPREERLSFSFHLNLHHWRLWSRLEKALTIILTVAILGIIITIGLTIAGPEHREAFTEFYLTGEGGSPDDVPVRLKTGQEGVVVIGVINHENRSLSYNIRVEKNGAGYREINPFTLKDGETFESKLTFTPEVPGDNETFDFLLYRNDTGEVYRQLQLYVEVVP